MNFKPFHHYLHVERVSWKTLGVSDSSAFVYRVVAVGPGFFDALSGKQIPMSSKVGDLVLLSQSDLVSVSYCGKEYLICQDVSVFGSFEV